MGLSILSNSYAARVAVTQLAAYAGADLIERSGVENSPIGRIGKAVASVFQTAPLAFTVASFVGSWALPVIVALPILAPVLSSYSPEAGAAAELVKKAAEIHMIFFAALAVTGIIPFAWKTLVIGSIAAAALAYLAPGAARREPVALEDFDDGFGFDALRRENPFARRADGEDEFEAFDSGSDDDSDLDEAMGSF